MKTKTLSIIGLIVILFAGCNSDTINNPVQNSNYTGQYQSVPYSDSQGDPTVVLLLAQTGNTISGTGTWNGITFNFAGTVIDNHVLINFKLTGTNIGDLNGGIDTYIGSDLSLAGGYNLFNSSYVLSGAIRFRKVNLSN